jgi:hypothetical protein
MSPELRVGIWITHLSSSTSFPLPKIYTEPAREAPNLLVASKERGGIKMTCKVHGQPKSMTCYRCTDNMCPMCAEYIDGSWFCPLCAAKERRIAAGIDYQDLIAIGLEETVPDEEPVEGEPVEL